MSRRRTFEPRHPAKSQSIVHWDIDRYGELQERAWELEASASDQDRCAPRAVGTSNGDATRAEARELRVEAAHMLAEYWVSR